MNLIRTAALLLAVHAAACSDGSFGVAEPLDEAGDAADAPAEASAEETEASPPAPDADAGEDAYEGGPTLPYDAAHEADAPDTAPDAPIETSPDAGSDVHDGASEAATDAPPAVTCSLCLGGPLPHLCPSSDADRACYLSCAYDYHCRFVGGTCACG